MRVKSAFGWSITWPYTSGERWVSLRVFPTRQEAIQFECWNQNPALSYATRATLSPWRFTMSAEVSRAWKKLYRRGYRAVHVEVLAMLFGMDREGAHPMRGPNLRRLAEAVAERLFTNGSGEVADRLVLTVDKPRRDLGGWSRRPAVDQIEEVLRFGLEGREADARPEARPGG